MNAREIKSYILPIFVYHTNRIYTRGRCFRSTPSRCFVESSRPTAHDAFGIRDVAFFFTLLELDANAWTSCDAGGSCPTRPPPFALSVDFFVGYHLHSREHRVLNTSNVKKNTWDIEVKVEANVHKHRSRRYANTRV